MGEKEKVIGSERNKIACHRCRNLKKKCSGSQPCSNCSKLGSKCVYSSESNRKPASKKYVSSLLKRIQVLSDILNEQNLIRSSEIKFLFEKSVDSVQQHEDSDADFLGLNDIWRLKFENSKFCFLGPSSGRNYEIKNTMSQNSLNDVIKNGLSERLPMNLHHRELFEWYFKHINTQIHIVSNELFFSSFSSGNNKFGPFASNALINAMFAITILKGPFLLDYKAFKDLAKVQVFHEINDLRITSVQTLIILSMIEMNDGNESQASVFIAMACSQSNHLGLHINLHQLMESKAMSPEELNLRQQLFWSCFCIDRMRCPILGIHPYLNITDISISLPVQLNDPISENFRELCFFLDLEDKTLAKLYQVKLKIDEDETSLKKKLLYLSETEMIIEKWKRRLPASCRFERKAKINDYPFFLSMCYETYKILVYKQWIKYPIDYLEDNKVNDPITICSNSAEYVIKNISPVLVQSPFLYRYLYSFYISSIICLFNTLTGNSHMQGKYNSMIMEVLAFYDSLSSSAEISKVYHSRLTHLKATLNNNRNGKHLGDKAENIESTENKISIVDDDFNSYLDLLFGSGI